MWVQVPLALSREGGGEVTPVYDKFIVLFLSYSKSTKKKKNYNQYKVGTGLNISALRKLHTGKKKKK